MNECIFCGRFTEDPQLQRIVNENDKETCFVNFELAINRKFKKSNGELGKNVTYLEFEAWDSGAEVICKSFRKGDAIFVHAAARNIIDDEGIIFRVSQFYFPSDQGLMSR